MTGFEGSLRGPDSIGAVAISVLPFAVLLLLMYGVGHCSVIVFAGTGTELLQKYLSWTEASKGAVILKRVCAVIVLLAGVYLIYSVR